MAGHPAKDVTTASARILVTGAGVGASNNLVRSLRAGDPSLMIVGCHDDRFLLKKSLVDRRYLIPPLAGPTGASALRRIVEAEHIDLVIPTDDAAVAVLSRIRSSLGDRVFLPRPSVIGICQDKHWLNVFLRARRIPVPRTAKVMRLDDLGRIFSRVAADSRAWCRIRTGAGSLGAIVVASADQARNWILYWRDMRGIAPGAFTLSEYLPGRDFGCQSLWKDGQLVVIKTYERLSYLVSGSQPTETSSVAGLAKTVVEPRVVAACVAAIRGLDAKASGTFSIDLKENAAGVPCITEINAGRFTSATPIFDFTGKCNMASTYVHLALGIPVEIREAYDVAEDHYMLRDLDTPPSIFHADDFFKDIHDARRGESRNFTTDRPRGRKQDGSLPSHVEQTAPPPQPRSEAQFQEPRGQGSSPKVGTRDQGTVSEVRAPRRGRQEARESSGVEGQEKAVTIPEHLDSQAAEAFWLELRELARRYGADIEERDGAGDVSRSRRAPARSAFPFRGRA